MFIRSFHPDRLLRTLDGSPPFVAYCQQRDIAFAPTPDLNGHAEDTPRWTAALRQLPAARQHQVETELAKVNELADGDSLAHLLDAIDGRPPPPDTVPGGAPLALWTYLHHPDLFHEVFVHDEILETGCWHTRHAPAGLVLDDLAGKAAALAGCLQDCFRRHEGTGRFCVVEPYALNSGYCFVASVADRLQALESFTERGEATLQHLWPAVPVVFVYDPHDGTLQLKSRLRASERVGELFQHFGRAVLGVELPPGECRFDLDRLKEEYLLLPDADDMEMARVKALHLRYPERAGGRHIKLETLAGDEPAALSQLLQAHLSGAGLFPQLHVSYAEIQITLRIDGQRLNYVIGLWPDRCTLTPTPLGQRFRSCLKRWGLWHVRQS